MAKVEHTPRRKRLSRFRQVWSKGMNNRKFVAGTLLVGGITVVSLLDPLIAPHDPTATNTANTLAGPSLTHPFGTDHLGRDIFSRVLSGGRISLFLGVSATLFGLALGIPVGLVAAYVGGRVDEALMRVMDAVMSFPSLLLALLILTVLSSSIWNAIMAIGVVYAPKIARVVRSGALSVKQEEFVEAARAMNESTTYVMFGEILPNILPPIIVEGSIRIGFAILVGTSLSFLGLGVQPPTPDWGLMIAEARNHTHESAWFLLWPSVALAITVIGFNLFGDGFRDVLDPQVGGEEL